ncbi:site-specific integrase [Cognatishimia activa]|uniref:Site-specific integrase n=1 Tax=Cognatishimia activa TaxID=1715691 RepID=A0A975ER55_9RHOB|nr:site-specific integrase [Cognatishimia activa]QTN36796.1 site-specific integrase [Cognatishimia activa]
MSEPEDMPRHTRLALRNGVYYHRAAVPKDIVQTYGKREESISLRTKDPKEALRKIKVVAVEVDERFDAHRRYLAAMERPALAELTAAQIAHIKQIYFAYILEEDEQERLEGFDEFSVDENGTLTWHSERPELPRKAFEEHQDDSEMLSSLTKRDYARGRLDEFIRGEAEEVLTWEGVSLRLDKDSPSWRVLGRALQEAIIEAHSAIKGRDDGEVIQTPNVAPNDLSRSPTSGSLPLFSQASQQFIEERSQSSWTERTKLDFQAQLRNFQEAVGDKPLDQYSKRDGRAFKSILQKLPANWRKKPKLKSKSIEAAAELASKAGLSPMNATTANKIMGRVSNFWTWADHNYFDDKGPEPLKGMAFKIQVSARDRRSPFEITQLNSIFASPIYKGHVSSRKWNEPGTFVDPASSRYWAFLISLFSGAREGEIFHLLTSNIEVRDGVNVMVIEEGDDGKRVKTSSSKRTIPIHSQLERLGLIRLVEDRRSAGHETLFHDCEDKTAERAKDNFSKWCSRFLEAQGVKSPLHVFHSLRHNFEDGCRAGGVEPYLMDALQGHAESGMRGVYGHGRYPHTVLKEAVEKVKYPGLSLGHLKGYH